MSWAMIANDLRCGLKKRFQLTMKLWVFVTILTLSLVTVVTSSPRPSPSEEDSGNEGTETDDDDDSSVLEDVINVFVMVYEAVTTYTYNFFYTDTDSIEVNLKVAGVDAKAVLLRGIASANESFLEYYLDTLITGNTTEIAYLTAAAYSEIVRCPATATMIPPSDQPEGDDTPVGSPETFSIGIVEEAVAVEDVYGNVSYSAVDTVEFEGPVVPDTSVIDNFEFDDDDFDNGVIGDVDVVEVDVDVSVVIWTELEGEPTGQLQVDVDLTQDSIQLVVYLDTGAKEVDPKFLAKVFQGLSYGYPHFRKYIVNLFLGSTDEISKKTTDFMASINGCRDVGSTGPTT